MAVVVKVVVVLFAYMCLTVLVFSLMRVSALAEPAPSANRETPARVRAWECRIGVVPGGSTAAAMRGRRPARPVYSRCTTTRAGNRTTQDDPGKPSAPRGGAAHRFHSQPLRQNPPTALE